MTRIKSGNVHVGGAFVVPIEQSANQIKIKEALGKEQEIILRGQQQAQEIIEAAQKQAQELIETATNEALAAVDEIKTTAHNEGFEAGKQEGAAKIEEELTEKVLSVNTFAECDFAIKKNIIKSAHLDIIRLIIEISHKVCSKSLEMDESILTELTKSAIGALKDKENITIIVNPEMAAQLYSISDELKERIPQLSSIKIIEDTSVSPDGTIVESPLSRVDCRIKAQIDEIAEKLMTKLNSTPDEELLEEVKSEE